MNVVELVAFGSLIINGISVFVTLTTKLEVANLRADINEKFISKKDLPLHCPIMRLEK